MINKTKKKGFCLGSFFPKKKNGVSGVVTVVILIALTIALISIVWMFVKNIVEDEMENAKSCLEVADQVKINKRYTCYERSNYTENVFKFSIIMGGIDVDEVVVLISSESKVKSFTINNSLEPISELGIAPHKFGDVILPKKDSGLTYITDSFGQKPDLIEIAPVVNGRRCEPTDSFYDIDDCEKTT